MHKLRPALRLPRDYMKIENALVDKPQALSVTKKNYSEGGKIERNFFVRQVQL